MDYSEFSKKLFSSGTTKKIIFKVMNISGAKFRKH